MNIKIHQLVAAVLGAGLLSSCATAQENVDETAAPQTAPLQAFYGFKTRDAATVVGALDQMMSDCGAEIPAQVSLFSELFNGTDPITHTVGFTYADADAMMKTGETFSSCPGSEAFYATINDVIHPVSNILSQPLVFGGDANADEAFMVFQMTVTDEATYGAAFAALMEASAADGTLPGSYGLNRLANVENGITHFAYIGAGDMASLLAANEALAASNSEARASFNAAVADIRTMLNSRITVRVKSYDPG